MKTTIQTPLSTLASLTHKETNLLSSSFLTNLNHEGYIFQYLQVRRLSLSTNIQEQLDFLGASDLLNPCFVNSFKMFSTKYESFV